MRSRNAKIGFCDCWILPEWCQDTFIHDSFWNWLFLFYNIHKLHVNHFVGEEIKWFSLFSAKKITFDRKVFECVWSWIQSEGGLCRKLSLALITETMSQLFLGYASTLYCPPLSTTLWQKNQVQKWNDVWTCWMIKKNEEKVSMI